jgi:hypothetical protein
LHNVVRMILTKSCQISEGEWDGARERIVAHGQKYQIRQESHFLW